jgi:tRNA G18 (ribose-2'-O)-methylase SpoU
MPILEIRSLDDPRLEPYRNLKRTNATRWSDRFIAEGDKLVRRAIAAGIAIESLLVGRRYAPEFATLVSQEVPLYRVDDAAIEELIGFNFHRGVLAHARRPSPLSLDALLATLPPQATIVLCPDLQDPENLGTLIRTSLALGVSALLLGPQTCDPFSRRVLRTSMGAAFTLPLLRGTNLAAELTRLRRDGFQVVATVTAAPATPLVRFIPPPRTAILIGNEAHGLSAEWLAQSDVRLTIPMRPGVDSLNAAIAAGIVLYHLTGR